jgi:serine protease Do
MIILVLSATALAQVPSSAPSGCGSGTGCGGNDCCMAATRPASAPVKCAQKQAEDSDVPFPSATPQARIDVCNEVFPAVVRLDVKQESYSEGKRRLSQGIGSGVIIDDQGRILTNFHVAGRAAEIHVTLFNKERVPGKLIGDDHWTDLAIVQMDMDVVRKKNIAFKHAKLGKSSDLVPGQDVMAIGTPFGLARTVTLGIVSNTDRTLAQDGNAGAKIDGQYETGEFNNWIQIDAAINPGNSGGPTVDMRGRVIGINTRGGGQNLNFAIPIDIAREVIAAILRTARPDRKGYVERSDLGIDFKPLQNFEDYYRLDINRGVLINNVERFSPAQKAGLATQDILLELNGQPTNVRFPEELAALRKRIADLPVGSEVRLSVKRDGQTRQFTMKTVRLQSAVGEERELKLWGMSVRNITRAYANEARLDEDHGVVITSVNPGYPADKADLKAGDVILKIGKTPVADLGEFMAAHDRLVKEKATPVVIEARRGRGPVFGVIKVSYP